VSGLVNLAEATVVKGRNAFCLALRDGSLPLDGDHPLGLYREDCRHLCGHELRLAGEPLRLLVADDVAATVAVCELTNNDVVLDDDGALLPMQHLRVRVERRISGADMTETITLHSYAPGTISLDLELALVADFRPIFEIRGLVAPHEREVLRVSGGNTVMFAATGLDRRRRTTTVTCAGANARDDGCLVARVDLARGERRTLTVRYAMAVVGRPRPVAVAPDAAADGAAVRPGATAAAPSAADADAAEAEAWLAQRPRLEIDDQLVDRVLRRSLLDLRALDSELDDRLYYAAGVPWYVALFGRDSIITALQTLWFDPPMAEQTLRLLAERIGTRFDDEHDEEPGKILHELRQGEIATAGLTPLTRYYGTVDATPLFLCLLCEHADWIGSLRLFRELRPQVEQALRWMDDYGDLDGDGLLEYRSRSPAGLINHGWKDSWDGIVDERGVALAPPIALVEAQGYAVRARRRLARLFELDGDAARAEELLRTAARGVALLERFWLPDRACYAMALDADKRPSRALASNQGHLLWSVAVPIQRARAIREALMGPGSYSGWGVRTLGSGEPAFNPLGYHTGTVWPHDNALLALGLRSYGFDDAFLRIFDDLLDAATAFPAYRLPELFAGYQRHPYEAPVPYPVACAPQAWAAGALPATLASGLGLVADGLSRTLRIRRPSLPRDVTCLAINGLRVGDASADLVFERFGRRNCVALSDVRVEGSLDVVVELMPGCDVEDAPSLAQVRTIGAATGRA
jgi:glycogen debranching enzyme